MQNQVTIQPTKLLISYSHYSNKKSTNTVDHSVIDYDDRTSLAELAKEILNTINQYEPTTADTSAEIKLQDIRESLVSLLRRDSEVSKFPDRDAIYEFLKSTGDRDYSAVQFKIVRVESNIVQRPLTGVVSDVIYNGVKYRNSYDPVSKIYYDGMYKAYIVTAMGLYLVTPDEVTLQKHGFDRFHASSSFETFDNVNRFIRSDSVKDILFCNNVYKYKDEYVSKIQQYNTEYKSLTYILSSDHVNITDCYGNKLYKLDHLGKEGYDMSCVPLYTIISDMELVF